MRHYFNLGSIYGTALAVALLAAPAANAAIIEWDGGGDGQSTFQEANWIVTDNTGQPAWVVGDDPPAGAVNAATDVQADVIVGGAGTAGGPVGATGDFELGDGFSLTVKDDAVFRMRLSPASGIRGVSGGSPEMLVLTDNASVIAQFLDNLSASLSDASTLLLAGGGNPINSSQIDLDPVWSGSVTFNNETPGAFETEHLSKFTVGGDPAVIGGNIRVLPLGASGSIVKLIPEPSSALLAALGAAAAFVRRKR